MQAGTSPVENGMDHENKDGELFEWQSILVLQDEESQMDDVMFAQQYECI